MNKISRDTYQRWDLHEINQISRQENFAVTILTSTVNDAFALQPSSDDLAFLFPQWVWKSAQILNKMRDK